MRTVVRILVLAAVLAPLVASGYPNLPTALKGRTLRDAGTGGTTGCAGCHAPGAITTTIGLGPGQLTAGATATYTVTATGATNGHRMGVVIATSAPNASPPPLAAGAPLTYFSDTRELIHDSTTGALSPVSGGAASYSFTFRMPATANPGDTVTLYAVSRVGISNTSDSGWSHAANFPVVTAPVAPGALTATGATQTSVSLSWSGSGPGYRIVYKTGASAPASQTDGTFIDLANVTATTVGGLTANTQYSFRVFSRSTSGAAVYTAGGSVTRTTAPAITSSLAQVNGTVGTPVASYTITAPGATTFGASNLPSGLTIVGAVISGTPTAGGTFNVLLTASNANGSDSQTKPYVIAAGSQTVTFGAAPTPSFSPSGTFSVSATASSGLPVTYSSNTTGVCTVASPSIGTVTIVTAGLCTIRADQAGNASYNAAFATQNVTIAAVVPAAPTAGAPIPGNATLTIPFTAPGNNGGAAITGYSAACTPSGSGASTASPIVVGSLANGTLYTCTVRAINSVGPGALSAPVTGTPRADPDGQLDPNFGTGGIAPFAFSGAPGANAFGMAVHPNGTVAVVGQTTTGDFAAARYGVNGVFDTKFNGTGMVTTDFGGANDAALGAAFYADMRLILVGQSNASGTNSVAIARFDNVGALDPAFGAGGKATLKLDPSSVDTAFGVALDDAGRIYITGQSALGGTQRFFVARVNENGTLDKTFGTNGYRIVPTGPTGGAGLRIVFDSQQRLVVAGLGSDATAGIMALARLDRDGNLDTQFNGTGVVLKDFGGDEQAYHVALDPSDGPIITGPVFVSGASDFAFASFTAAGAPLLTVTADVAGNRVDQARGIVRQPDGRIVIAGLHNNGSNLDYALMRFEPGGAVDTTFGANGRTVTPVGTSDVMGIGTIAVQLPGTVVVAGTTDGKMVLMRYLLDAPSAISFIPPSGPIGTITFVTSNTVPIANTAIPVYVEVTGGFYSIDCNPAGFTTVRGQISSGQSICVRHQTANNPGQSVTTTLVVGGQVATFTSTTTFDATPDAFTFVDQVNVTPGATVTSNAITVAGINGPAPISVSGGGGSYSIGCNGTFTTVAGTINNGQTVCVRHTASAGFSTQVDTTLFIGAVFDTFSSTTAAIDTTPDPFAFTDVTGIALSTQVTSNAITVAGINSPAAVSVTGGSYSIGCTSTFVTAAGTIANGQAVCVRHTSAAAPGTATNTVLTIGGVSDTFTSTTLVTDTVPDAFSFNDVTGVTPGAVITSNAITVAGINTPSPISVSGGTYSIGCTATFTSAPSTIDNGQAVCVRHTAPLALSATTNTTLTVGGVADVFSSTTLASLPPGGDQDNDGIPNGVEGPEARNPFVKDNDVFGNARLFAMQQYRDFLGREGDAGGIQFYVDALDGATTSRAQVIENFFNSPEFGGTVSPIARLYFATFLRIPDYPGLIFQVDAFRAGTPLAVIANNFTLSPEFQATYGALDNAAFVALLYQNILGRTASQPEIDFHVARLASGVSRGAVLVGFSESPEYQQLTYIDVYVTMMYVGMLRRAPEQAGFDFWVAYMEGGNSGLALIMGFLNAPEYRSRFLP